jgi:hypothetical protein
MSGGVEEARPAVGAREGVPPAATANADAGAAARRVEPPWPLLVQRFRAGKLIPFLGAGASAYHKDDRGRAPPSVSDLIRKLAANAELPVQCDANGCGQLRFDLARIASYYQTCYALRPDLDDFLKSEIADPVFNPNPLHYLLARVARHNPMLIITTNYDDLLEKAFDNPADGGGAVPYDVLVTPVDDLAYEAVNDQTGPAHAGGIWYRQAGQTTEFERVADSDLPLDISQRSVIYKIHGSVPRGNSWTGGYLIAEEDYARFLGRMEFIVPAAIQSHIKKKNREGSAAVRDHSLLFLGYGMRDWNLRLLFEQLRVGRLPSNQEKHFAVLLRPDEMEVSFFKNRNVDVYNCDLNHFVSTVAARLP